MCEQKHNIYSERMRKPARFEHDKDERKNKSGAHSTQYALNVMKTNDKQAERMRKAVRFEHDEDERKIISIGKDGG